MIKEMLRDLNLRKHYDYSCRYVAENYTYIKLLHNYCENSYPRIDFKNNKISIVVSIDLNDKKNTTNVFVKECCFQEIVQHLIEYKAIIEEKQGFENWINNIVNTSKIKYPIVTIWG